MNKILFIGFIILTSSCAFTSQVCLNETPIESVPPAYPRIGTVKAHSGYAIIKYIIDQNGYVLSPQVVESHSEPTEGFAYEFGISALEAVKLWKFEKRAIACESETKVIFELSK